MSKINFPKKQEQRLIPKYLLEYSEELVKNHPDPSADWGGGGGSPIEAGTGIIITGDEIKTISVDDESVAMVANLAPVAFSGSYNDLSNKPTIPTKTSELTNDSGYLVAVTWNDIYNKPTFATVAISGDYNDLTNKPTIPTNTSDLTNDSGFITSAALTSYITTTQLEDALDDYALNTDIPTDVSELNNDAGYITNNALTGYATETYVNNAISGLSIPTKTSDLTNDSGFITSSALSNCVKYETVSGMTYVNTGYYYGVGYEPGFVNTNMLTSTKNVFKLPIDKSGTIALTSDIPTVPTNVSAFTNDAGYITGITSSMVTTALGYTPGTSNFDGAYNSLTGKPDLSIYAQSANLATVATSGSYTDLTNKPTIPTVVDTVADGNMNAVTSNAVYDIVGDIETLLAAL